MRTELSQASGAAGQGQSWGPGLDQPGLRGRSVEGGFGLDELQVGTKGMS